MATNPFTLPFERLPATLPIFPLRNAIVMPGAQLPLNIFEPRYLNMVFDCLGTDRMIGMVQPDPASKDENQPGVYRTGTAGRITSFSETLDGRLLIVMTGVCRFDIREEIPTTRDYRRVIPDWDRFRVDYALSDAISCDRGKLMELLKDYFQRKSLSTDWTVMEQMSFPVLVNVLISQLPFEVAERQALVEAVSVEDRYAKLLGLLEFEMAAARVGTDVRQH
ncbi:MULTISPECIES: LON peptidase substrate-binding domain-containing protein [Methylocaldum]|jgi:Lon protease-like protein|uniref:LON peptidase substrate-binding domain-containing protein n=1 Tax=unclassified Methylocaldum TaxID=2622260 RepID=UPI00098ABF96|nr:MULTISPECIES: LON peptidase substrate-binding domain-containing protein [unclassified Methylocaldum]MBP1151393.1 Lon protease-like protein [Methylocaldum sp. RMAD-M]MVF23859.1 peptidase S16 [Methylocaldum sp. BRCS4]